MVVTEDCKGFIFVTFAALAVDITLVDEAVVVAVVALVPHGELVVVLGFGAVAGYVVDVLDSRVVVAFHLAVYLVVVVVVVVVVVISPLDRIEVHVDVVLMVLPVFQELLTKLVHLTDQL